MKKRKGIDGELDQLWSLAVKVKAGMKCEKCGKVSYIQSHHIYSRSKKSTRWSLANGISLCAAHHTLSSGFSAHKTPTEFTDWVKEYRGEEWYDLLRDEANSFKKWSKEEKEELKDSLKLFIKDNEENYYG